MPLSKKRDKERKRLARLENKNVQPVPLYNPSIHRAGDTVRILKFGKYHAITIPELNADGQPIPD